ncbi:MAG TPA: PAS domain-containing protein, partial [Pyrinomonadaceae bacterium]|nr:PAS domain-containing protein [Pyrinomonadaceae bacterium]
MQQPFDHNSTLLDLSGRSDLLTFLDVSPLPALVIDRDQRITAANDSARDFLITGEVRLVGARFGDWIRSAERIVWLTENNHSGEKKDRRELCE